MPTKTTTGRACRCGCGFDDLKAPRLYRSGHDRRHVEALVRRWNDEPLNRDGVRLLADAQLTRGLFFEFLRRIGAAS